MKQYEVTGYIQIPVFVTVKAATAAEALEKGTNEIEKGFGTHGDPYFVDEYSVWDIEADCPVVNKIIYAALRGAK
jgi:hypothetical protein